MPYWATSRDPNSSGSSAPRATGTPASNSCRTGTSRVRRGDAQRHVGRRADLQRDAARRQPLDQLVVGRGPHAVPDPVRVQLVQAGQHAGRPGQLTPVRDGEQAAAFGDAEGRGEVFRPPAPLVVTEPEAGHAPPGVLHGQPGQRARVQRVPGPVGGDDDRDPHAGRRAGRGRGVQHELDGGSQAAEASRVPRRVDLDLQPAGSLGPFVLRDLASAAGRCPPGSAAPTAPCRTAAGTGTSPARRRRSASAATPRSAPRAGGRGVRGRARPASSAASPP